MSKTIPVDIGDLSAEGVDVALALVADFPDGASTDLSLMGAQIVAHRFRVEPEAESDTGWEVSTEDFNISAKDNSLPRAVARALLIKHVIHRKGERYALRVNYARAKALFDGSQHGSAVDVAVMAQCITDVDIVELELHSICED